MENIVYLIILIIAELLILFLFSFISEQKKEQIKTAFMCFLFCLGVWTLCLICQIALQKYPINPFFFEKIAGFGAFYSPVSFFFLGKIFSHTKIKFKKSYFLLFIIPTCSLLLAFTNDYHHLFVKNYSVKVEETVWGPYFPIHSIYTFILYMIGIWDFFRYSIKNSGFFSKQSIFIIIGTIIPLVVNLLGLFGVPMPVYWTPISFTTTILCYSLAIFRFQFIRVTPIALQKIVDRISDGFIVLNSNYNIIDFNDAFIKMFDFNPSHRNKNLFKILEKSDSIGIDINVLKRDISEVRVTNKTFQYDIKYEGKNKYYHIEINSIFSKDSFLGILILLKDTTQHMLDMQMIQDKQDMLMEKERLASLGQLIGGIAHNLKTPIMSISGASEGLNDLILEYDSSIDDPEVNSQDHHAIAKDMTTWITKIRSYTEYMSDVITAVKGQAVTLSNEGMVSFTIEELIKRVDILMKHELKNALINLEIDVNADPNTLLTGNVNSLVQVINNMISNSIQAYKGKTNQNINLTISSQDNNIIICIKDYAGGIPKSVQDKLFKEMITTKGKNGTGLGLFMSYSTIKAHFNGNICVDSELGVGTTFTILLPINH